MQDKISVIVPIYNVERYVDKCVASIVKQTYRNLEIILVDDGSTDSSGDICDKWADKDERIIVLHKENEGVSGARNDGLKVATGRYVGFVDGDDWIEDDMYEYLYHLIKKYDADISMCAYNLASEHEVISIRDTFGKEEIEKYERKSALWELVQDKKIHSYVWDKLFEKKLFDGITYPIGRYEEDMFTLYRIFMKSDSIIFGHEPKYNYFQRSNSVQRSRGEKLDWDQFCVYEDWFKCISKVYPEWEQYLLEKWLSFAVCAYNSILLRKEVGNETLEHKKIILNTIKKYHGVVGVNNNKKLKFRLRLIKMRGYEYIYPILKRMLSGGKVID